MSFQHFFFFSNYVSINLAKMYLNSSRTSKKFGNFTPLGKYFVKSISDCSEISLNFTILFKENARMQFFVKLNSGKTFSRKKCVNEISWKYWFGHFCHETAKVVQHQNTPFMINEWADSEPKIIFGPKSFWQKGFCCLSPPTFLMIFSNKKLSAIRGWYFKGSVL